MMSKQSDKPRILLTLGDPNGIGPEIILRIFSDISLLKKYDLNVIGSVKVLNYYSSKLKLPKIISSKVISLSESHKTNPGNIGKSGGKISGTAVKKGIELCLLNKYDALVTLPISKEAFALGGFDFPGHTEMLTELTGGKDNAMIMYSKKIILSLVTVHIPLNKVKSAVSQRKIVNKIITVNNSLIKDLNLKKPSFAITGLNPHAGDGGKLGNEEINIISPAVIALKETGFNISGPFPADGFFTNEHYQKYDCTMTMYHDQGLIPFKMLSKDKGVNYTAGLKIIRTSPNHGTGFDIAGKGIANPNSTIEAIKLASEIYFNRR